MGGGTGTFSEQDTEDTEVMEDKDASSTDEDPGFN